MYVGKYRSRAEDLQVLVLDGRLVAFDPRAPPPIQEMTSLPCLGGHRRLLAGKDGFAAAGEVATFELDERTGEVAALRLSDQRLMRVPSW